MPLSLTLPTVGGSNNTWGGILNTDLTSIQSWGNTLETATSTLVFNVLAYGATGNGSTDDTAAIQAAINASTTGSTVYFPAGTYIISATLSLAGDRSYIGTHRLGCKIKVKNGANLTQAMASASVLATAPASGDLPIRIAHLFLDGNSANQTAGAGHGIVIRAFWSDLDDVEVNNTRGVGIRLSTVANDNTELTQQGPENRIDRCVVRNAGSHGFQVYDPDPANQATNGLTDGWFNNCVVEGSVGDGIRIDCGAGWEVSGCHIYGAAQHGINVGRGGTLRIIGNYIETNGFSTTVNWWAAISVGDGVSTLIGAGGGIVVADNVAFYDGAGFPVAAGSNYLGVIANVSSGVTAEITIANNTVDAAPAGAECANAVWIAIPDNTTTAKVRRAGNSFKGFTTNLGIDAGSATLNQFAIEREEFFSQNVAYATPLTPDTSFGEHVIIGTLTGNITVNTPTYPYKGQRLFLSFTEDATGGRTITLNASYKKAWTPTTTANKRNTVEFVCEDAATPTYVQVSGIVGI